MAINKKSNGKVTKPGYPSKFVKLVTDAATYAVVEKFFDARFGDAKEAIKEYLETDDCPVVVNVGEKGSNPKLDGLGTVIVSQPERLDNKAAAATIVELLKDGKLNPDDLLELVSQVNKEALAKIVDQKTIDGLVKRDEDTDEIPLQISMRVDAAFKTHLTDKLEANVAEIVKKVA